MARESLLFIIIFSLINFITIISLSFTILNFYNQIYAMSYNLSMGLNETKSIGVEETGTLGLIFPSLKFS